MQRVELPISLEEVVELYNSGKSIKKIADYLGVSAWTLHDRLRKADVKLRPIGRNPKPIDLDKVRKLRNEGVSWANISIELGLCRESLRVRFEKAA